MGLEDFFSFLVCGTTRKTSMANNTTSSLARASDFPTPNSEFFGGRNGAQNPFAVQGMQATGGDESNEISLDDLFTPVDTKTYKLPARPKRAVRPTATKVEAKEEEKIEISASLRAAVRSSSVLFARTNTTSAQSGNAHSVIKRPAPAAIEKREAGHAITPFSGKKIPISRARTTGPRHHYIYSAAAATQYTY